MDLVHLHSDPATLIPSTGRDDILLEDRDLSDVVLEYISRILMEEDTEDTTCMFQESSMALRAAERSFYEVLGEEYPPSPGNQLSSLFHQDFVSLDENYIDTSGHSGSSNLLDPWWIPNFGKNRFSYGQAAAVNHSMQSSSQLVDFSLTSGRGDIVDGCGNSLNCENNHYIQFGINVDEASHSDIFVNILHKELWLSEEPSNEAKNSLEKEDRHLNSLNGSRGRKNSLIEDVNPEFRRNAKQAAISTESTLRSQMFDMMLLSCREECESAMRQAFQNIKLKGSNDKKGPRKKSKGKRVVVDLRTLLMDCAQTMAYGRREKAYELVKQIRQDSSPNGSGIQRLASYFSDAFEARLAGSGNQSYTALLSRSVSAADILKAQHLFLAICPFLKISHFFSNKTIMQVSEKATQLHIIDFGIYYGFQWPSFIEQLSSRPGGPPKLRITGIDFPNPGFRPAERIEETGRRLAEYAKRFDVPFEFYAIAAQAWETIQIEDIRLETGEVLVINTMFRFRYLLDESVISKSPRNAVLDLIRKINPDVFIQAVANAAYNVPFFLTRFREALFHYSAMFDLLETTVPREVPERMIVEKEILGREIMNVIACEGLERIERAETYKQWQARNLRAGFRQLPLNKDILKTAKEWMTKVYNKDFVVDNDGQWLLQGWKGRILNALASWEPVR